MYFYTQDMHILVALSGGIDSSVMAHMLAAEGHELMGVRFQLWTDPLAPAIAEILPSKCCNAQTAMRSKWVADRLSIPYHIIDLQNEFKTEVVDPFLKGYAEGLTPNPCINCNREIKFGKLLELADELGCEKLATGHYARTAVENLHDGSSRMLLLEAVDQTKDQSYYLYGLTQEQLSRVMFPLGSMQKADVYELARKFDIPFDDESYRESQDLCFFPEKAPKEFFKRYLKDALTPGPIKRRDGTVVGTHEGLPLYTIGQRRGLGIGGLKIPLEVVSKNADENALIVADQNCERTNAISLTDVRFVSWMPEQQEPTKFECRTRSLGTRQSGTFTLNGNKGVFHFAANQPLPAPGQSLVLYKGEEVVGGGVID